AYRSLHSFPTRRSSDLAVLVTGPGFTAEPWTARSPGRLAGYAGLREVQGLAGQRRPGQRRAGIQAEPLLHRRALVGVEAVAMAADRKSTRLNSSHDQIS